MNRKIVLNQPSLSCTQIWEISLGAHLEVSPDLLKKMNRNAAQCGENSNILASKRHWLTGFSSSTDGDLRKAFILGHCAGVGPAFPKQIVRAAMAARINVLLSGVTGSRGIVVEKLLELLNKDMIPTVPSQGSVGAAGDLAPMAHIARTLCGYDGGHPNYTPLIPTDKEALALINGVSLSTAIAAIAIVRTEKIFDASIIAAGLSMEVVRAQSQCLDPRALEVRQHPEVAEVGSILRNILRDSQRVLGSNKPDAFSIRAGPSVLGAILRTLRFAKEEITRELNGVSDNPLLFNNENTSQDDCDGGWEGDWEGDWVEAGNFHGASVAMAMDHLKTALAQLATLCERRIFRLTHGKLSNNLPSFLVQGTGLNSGFMLAQYTAAALASEVKGYSHPASADSIPTVQHHEDHVSMAPIAARHALKGLECVADIVAIELLVGAQALDLRFQDDGLPAPLVLQCVHDEIRKKVPFWNDDNVLHPAISAMSEWVRQGIVLNH